MPETRFGITIEGRDESASAVGSAIREYQALGQEILRLKRSTEETPEATRRLGEMFLRQREIQEQLRKSTSQLADGQRDLSGAARDLTRELGNQAGPFGRIVASVGEANIAAGLGAAALAAFGFSAVAAARSIGSYQEHVDLVRESTDLTAREIGGLSVAASNSGRTFESIEPNLAIFTRRIAEARDGSADAVTAFQRVGISLRDLRSLSTGELLQKVSEGLQNAGDAADRSRILFELFGRGGSQMMAILAQDMTKTQEIAIKLGITLSEQQVKIARDANVASQQFALSWEGALNRIKLAIAPVGTALLRLAKPGEGSPGQLGGGAGGGLSLLEFLAPYLAPHVPAAPAMVGPPLPPNWEARSAAIAEQQNAADQFSDAVKNFWEATDEQKKFIQESLVAGAAIGKPYAYPGGELTPGAMKYFGPQAAFEGSLQPFYPNGPPQVRLGPYPLPPERFPTTPVRADSTEKEAKSVSEAIQGTLKGLRGADTELKSAARTLTVTLANGLVDAIEHAKSLGDVLLDVFDQALRMGVSKGLTALFGLQGGGTPAHLYSGGTLISSQVIHAQSGIVKSGARGADTVAALVGRDEMYLSHADTDMMRSEIPRMSRRIDELSRRGSSSSIYAPVTVTVNEAQLRGRPLETFVSETLVNELVRVQASGNFRIFNAG